LEQCFSYQDGYAYHSHLEYVDGGYTANTAPSSTTTDVVELTIYDSIAYGKHQHLSINTTTTDAAEIPVCDSIAYGSHQAMHTDTDLEYERLDQPVHTYEILDQDKITEDKTEHSDNIAFGNLQPIHTNTNPEYETLDQLVHTYGALDQDEKMEDKPKYSGASTNYAPSD